MGEIKSKGNHYVVIIDGEEFAECDTIEECKKEIEEILCKGK